MERAFAMLLPNPGQFDYPLRMPDDSLDDSFRVALQLRADALEDFPFAHLRLFTILNSRILSCWRGLCQSSSGSCQSLSAELAVHIQRRLASELKLASENFEGLFRAEDRHADAIKAANVLLTVRWLQGRFWDLSRQHGLVNPDSAHELQVGLLEAIFPAQLRVLQQLKAQDFDSGMDWAVKLFDLTLICTGVMRDVEFVASQRIDPATLKANLLPHVYAALSMLAAVRKVAPLSMAYASDVHLQHTGAQKRFMPELLASVAAVT